MMGAVDMEKLVGDAESNLWLHAAQIKQPGGDWADVSSDDCWMPLDLSGQSFILVEATSGAKL
jgi:hypothetical protein